MLLISLFKNRIKEFMIYNNIDSIEIQNPISIGIIGGGQLGKMIAQEAKRMSFKVIILDPTADSPASSVSDESIIADFKDENAITTLANKSDVLTYEIELANSEILKDLSSKNFIVHPSPETLGIIQNKLRQKLFLKDHGIPVGDFDLVMSKSHLTNLCERFGYPSILKICENSYDGRGNYIIRSEDNIPECSDYLHNRQCMLEKFIPFKKEISVMIARNPSGQISSFPIAENIHRNSILDTTIVPARISSTTVAKAEGVAEKTMKALKGSGIFGIEMFVTKDEQVLVNEIAPRPHNSGHYSIEACSISQFEQHLRAILDLPLSKPELLSPAVMVNILGPEDFSGPYMITGLKELLSIAGVKLHIYGKKTSSPRRKLGHITVTAGSPEKAMARAEKVKNIIKIELVKKVNKNK
jgi:5-(carboxyamino)imidazole ribonucleotide synthase